MKAATLPADAPRPRGPAARPQVRLVPLAFVLAGLAILIALGGWQLQRLAWKERMLAHVAALKTAGAQPIGPVLARAARGEDVDFTRVTLACPALEQTPTIRLYAVNDSGQGYRLLTACPLSGPAYRTILVDRGFVSQDDAARVRPAIEPLDREATGVLRRTGRPSFLIPRHTRRGAVWYGRDLPAMAAELGAAHPAPVFLMLESPASRGFGPTPQPLPGEIRNPHLGYALTWFGLAAALAGVYVASLLHPAESDERPRAQ